MPLKYFWQSFAWALVILILCGLPGDDLPELTFLEWLRPDKIAHLILFGIQSYFLLKGFYQLQNQSFFYRKAVAFSLIFTICYGALVEILQTYVFIHRDGDVRDAAANAIGAFLGVWFFKRKSKKENLLINNSSGKHNAAHE
jgi:glycopeptide antibiotics resistance protein